ncbi:hypothetical protein H5410_025118 [Solanum commersonii]|uniref:Sulfotransferase n=1 Tax=Solanum commersonii TaxID=4109 RepID=A0A9J5YTC6_SOLCO|nr:hypothetical protein H5410_025118 [Solanum commersonii]
MSKSQASTQIPPKYLQEDELSDECTKLLLTLPKERGWLASHIYNYQGFGQHQESFKNPHDLVPFLELTLYVDGQVADFSSFTTPRLLNPKDTFISMWHFANNLRLHHKDTNSIGKVFDLFAMVLLKASIENPNKVLFLMYEEIKEQPNIQIKRLAEFLECPFSIKEENCGVVDEILRMCSFKNLSNLEVNTTGKLSTGEENKVFFRRGEIGDWKSYFTTEMSFWALPRIIQGVIACQQQVHAQDSDIILVTPPKSGTTCPHDLIPFLEIKLYVDGLVPNFASFTSPRLLSTHLPFASLPKSVQDSKIKLGVSPYGPFWNHVLDYWKQSIEKPNKVLFLMYEEIKVQPKLQLKRLAEFLECPFSIEEENGGVVDEILRMCSFENLSNLEVNTNGKLSTRAENKVFFRKGEVGDWKNYFTIKMSEKLNHIIKQKFQESEIKFSYI